MEGFLVGENSVVRKFSSQVKRLTLLQVLHSKSIEKFKEILLLNSYDNAHSCTYDYKTVGREQLRKSNPQVFKEIFKQIFQKIFSLKVVSEKIQPI